MSEIQNSSIFSLDDVSDEKLNQLIDGTITDFEENELVDEILIGHVICEYCPEETAYPIAEAARTESK